MIDSVKICDELTIDYGTGNLRHQAADREQILDAFYSSGCGQMSRGCFLRYRTGI